MNITYKDVAELTENIKNLDIINSEKNISSIIQELPLNLQYLIFEYAIINEKNKNINNNIKYYDNYIFDKDFVYFNIEPLIFINEQELQVSLYTWFGTYSPETHNFDNGKLLHTIFDRTYCQNLERSFGIISEIIYNNVKQFKFRRDLFYKDGKTLFSGTHGPLKKSFDSVHNIPFHKLTHYNIHYQTKDILSYFKKINIIDKDVKKLTENITNIAINNLKKNIISSLMNINDFYNKISKNYLFRPIIKTNIKSYNNNEYEHQILFFKLCKHLNLRSILKKQFIKKIKEENKKIE